MRTVAVDKIRAVRHTVGKTSLPTRKNVIEKRMWHTAERLTGGLEMVDTDTEAHNFVVFHVLFGLRICFGLDQRLRLFR